MSTVDLKENLHELIDSIQNSNLLESLHDMLSERKNAKVGHHWNSLTDTERTEVLEAYEESKDSKNLISHSEILGEFK